MTWYAVVALIVAVGLQLADIVTTVIVLDEGGSEVGFARLLVRWGWPRWAWMIAVKSLFAAFVTFAYFSGELAFLAVLGILSLLTLYAVWHNLAQIAEKA